MKLTDILQGKSFSHLLAFLIGVLCCLYLTKEKCVSTPQPYQVIDNTWIEHAREPIRDTIEIEVPKPVIVYRKLDDIPTWLTDSLENLASQLLVKSDSIVMDTTSITLNYYEDSVKTKDYELVWKAETFGFLTSMVAQVTTFTDSVIIKQPPSIVTEIKSPNWTIGAGISNQLNYKLNAGYKGWLIETEFNKRSNFNQIYLTKQFYF